MENKYEYYKITITTNYSRRTLIVCFNTKSNSPFNKEISHAVYSPLNVLSSDSIMKYKFS